MAKIYGLFGSMTGKLADTVMSVRNGEQIARKYQPVVFNPSTPAQVATRAKLKLLSQLSAVMAPYIAIRRVGSMSSRNLFFKKNYRAVTFNNGIADIALGNVSLTKSVVGLPNFTASRSTNVVICQLNSGVSGIDKVVYVAFAKQDDGTLRAVGSVVVSQAGEGGDFPGQLPSVSRPLSIFAYGVRMNTEAARVIFSDMRVDSAADLAKVVTSSNLLESDITLTETKYFALESPQS